MGGKNMKTVNEVSKITGVSVRTLHYYDTIGLLKPTQVTQAGYRLYNDTALEKLQIILIFRELQFPLKEIKKILEHPHFNLKEALEAQIKLLELQQVHIEKLISLAHQIQEEGVNKMDFKTFDNTEFHQYAAEVKERWGTTKEYEEYSKKIENKSEQELKDTQKQLMDLFAEMGQLKQLAVTELVVQEKVKKLQQFITEHYYNCTKEVLKGLGQMYVEDERFKNNIDRVGGKGTAEFVKQAILEYCSK